MINIHGWRNIQGRDRLLRPSEGAGNRTVMPVMPVIPRGANRAKNANRCSSSGLRLTRRKRKTGDKGSKLAREEARSCDFGHRNPRESHSHRMLTDAACLHISQP